jgi:anti-anti-sigma regulatory factor
MKFQVEEQGGTTKVVVSGEITEETDFAPILDAKGRTILVDLGGVSRINSCGVREWLNFVTALEQRGRQLVLERCAPVIVTQLNTIYNFAGDGHVRSVLGPYYCARCDREDNQLIELAKTRSIPESIKCSSCGGEMEFEEVHDHYLGFRDGGS